LLAAGSNDDIVNGDGDGDGHVKPVDQQSALDKPSDDAAELPRRERQASLAEELRTGFTEELPSRKSGQRKEQDEEENSERTPEQIRTIMTTFQRGSLQGQQAADALNLPPADQTTDAPVH
ncbi:MAG: hypothetical protein ACREP9_18990, partial [Candidatus Dormibacteraceae bacterium]